MFTVIICSLYFFIEYSHYFYSISVCYATIVCIQLQIITATLKSYCQYGIWMQQHLKTGDKLHPFCFSNLLNILKRKKNCFSYVFFFSFYLSLIFFTLFFSVNIFFHFGNSFLFSLCSSVIGVFLFASAICRILCEFSFLIFLFICDFVRFRARDFFC